MCGIAGVVKNSGGVSRERLAAMTDMLARRGPDGAGYWVADDGAVGLGHRRLSILDVSDAGAQPMVSPSGRYRITFNGEIYNFRELRAELEAKATQFRGHSDTEVLLAACDVWGIEATLPRLDGMFAFAVWDERERALTLARDRIGIKPLYYACANGELVFASEIRPIVAWLGTRPRINPAALSEYLRLAYVPCPLSIFEGIFKLPPGTSAVYRDGKLSKPREYWSLAEKFRAGFANPIADEREALTALETTLCHAVKRHMIADVPLGAFLSGGVDSSSVVALMQQESVRPVKTFTIGFREDAFNEAAHAAAVAKHLGTEHHELYVSDADARSVIPHLPEFYDEPFADASQIPTYLVSKLAREHVTVALSGDGGDELFAGYNRYLFVEKFWAKMQHVPAPLRAILARIVAAPSAKGWETLFRLLAPILAAPVNPAEKMHKVAKILSSRTLFELHRRITSQWVNPAEALAPAWRSDVAPWNGQLDAAEDLPPVARQMLWDAETYMVDDILTKVDRASMVVGLEARVPLLDHRVVELAYRLPLSMKLRGREGKYLLRQLLYQHVPRELTERPKMGFGIPLDAWLRGPLRDWAETYLAEDRLRAEGYFDVAMLRETWRAHLSGKQNHGAMLWTVLMFQLWWERAKQWT